MIVRILELREIVERLCDFIRVEGKAELRDLATSPTSHLLFFNGGLCWILHKVARSAILRLKKLQLNQPTAGLVDLCCGYGLLVKP
jgi:hypothetical protein